jgi:uncharacterized membrane protein
MRAAAHAVAVLIEAAGSALLAGFVAAACGVLLRGGAPERARLLVAEGAVLALGLKTGATLLKTPDLPGWDRIVALAAILALRTALKRAFTAEATAIARRSAPPGGPAVSPAPSPHAAGRAG